MSQKPGTVDALLLELWRQRASEQAVVQCCSELAKIAQSQIEKLEMYLPQFAHLLISLADDVAGVRSIEHFILSACQMSLHVTLQLFWMLYAALQENRPKLKKSDRAIYARCARLLLQLEQCVVYSVEGESAVDDVMSECAKVAEAVQSGGASSDPEQSIAMKGFLLKKGGGHTRFGRTSWHKRYVIIRNRVLYYYAHESLSRSTPEAPFGKAIGSMALNTAVVSKTDASKYANAFELRDKQTGETIYLRASTEAEALEWMNAIKAIASLPEPPGMDGLEVNSIITQVSDTTEHGSAANAQPTERLLTGLRQKYGARSGSGSIMFAQYEYFNSQREFLRAMTDVAEELRHFPAGERQELLQSRLDTVTIPPHSYFPLVRSDEECCSLLRFTPYESIVFNTKARCPLMLICEVKRQDYTVSKITRKLSETIVTASGGGDSDEPTPTLHEKKREKWDDKAARIARTSPLASTAGWEVRSFIVKSNDDLRQEVFIMQMISFFKTIWSAETTWINGYHILATGPDTGLIETITGSTDLDNLKKQPGYGSLRKLFIQRYGEPGTPGFLEAQANFSKSLAGYSLVMWILQLRDRHNGNLMLDEAGHYFHIDFGFCLGHSTGKQIGGLVECSPFKLTEEYIELLDGRGSPVYENFCDACVDAMQAAHEHAGTICTMVDILGQRSKFPCFKQTHVSKVIPALEKRLFKHLSREEVGPAFRKVLTKTAGHWGSRRYDWFQNLQQGIAI